MVDMVHEYSSDKERTSSGSVSQRKGLERNTFSWLATGFSWYCPPEIIHLLVFIEIFRFFTSNSRFWGLWGWEICNFRKAMTSVLKLAISWLNGITNIKLLLDEFFSVHCKWHRHIWEKKFWVLSTGVKSVTFWLVLWTNIYIMASRRQQLK